MIDPYRNVSAACQVIKDLARMIYTMTRARLPFIWLGRGYDTPASGSVEHASRRALDVMIADKVGRHPTSAQRAGGDELAAWLIKHADTLHIRHLIWNGRIWKRRYRGTSTAWSKLNRAPSDTNVSSWHYDHIHIYLDDDKGRAPTAGLDGAAAPTPAPPKPAPPKPAPPKPAPPKPAPLVVSVAHLKAARYADPPKKGTPTGPHAAEVRILETALAATGWMDSRQVDGHYGTATVGNGSLGVGGTTGFQRKHSRASRPDGWLGATELALLFKLAGMNVTVKP